MQLFFHSNLDNNILDLPEDESKHCVRVIRKKVGDEIILIDGKGNKAFCKIIDDNQKKCKLEIFEKVHFAAKAINLHIAISPTKNFDRMDWMLEKCTEIGVSEITFIETENSERNKINMERCEKILIQSIKQSKQYWLPKLNNLISFKQFILNQKTTDLNCLIAWCIEHTSTFKESIDLKKSTLILIGPEGDFTELEAKMAIENNFKTISLGENILRTETAAVYAAAVINNLMSS
jgi:16S rRNA (uracil1498-N3)-methyltransferase